VAREVDAQPGRAGGELTLILRRGLAVRGRVLGPDGRPVRGAEVNLERQVAPGRPAPGYPPWGCLTAADGTFAISGLPAGSGYEWVVIHPTLRLGARLAQAFPQGRREPLRVEVRLRPLASVAGRVLDDRGAPLPGAAVRIVALVRLPGSARGEKEVEAAALTADGAGRFSFNRLLPDPRRRLVAEVWARGHVGLRSAAFEVSPGGTRTLPDLVLPRAADVSGTVVDRAGRPLADGRVRARLPARAGGEVLLEPPPVVTGRDGRFRLTGLPAGPLEVEADLCVQGQHDDSKPSGPAIKVKVEAGRREAPLVLKLDWPAP
jgi:hypothetical protein